MPFPGRAPKRLHCPPSGSRRGPGPYKQLSRGEDKAVDECHPTPPSYLDIPVLIQVIDTSDAAPVAMGIVNVSHVPQPVSWVTCHHGLAEMMEIGFTDRDF